jgi:hypothetical protein
MLLAYTNAVLRTKSNRAVHADARPEAVAPAVIPLFLLMLSLA